MRLDDLYKMTAAIYEDANLSRSREATYLHFVEVCAMLTLVHRVKMREDVDVPSALCKALGWYFPLLAKMGVASVEELIFSKYPNACPYCRENPHNERECKLAKGPTVTVSHADLKVLIVRNKNSMPESLNEWQAMFMSIYPRHVNAGSFSIVALFEEIGEMAEAVRVYDRYPHYFFGEAADAFSYIMGIANEYSLKNDFDFEKEFLSRYPGLCVNCGSRVCVCPPVPQATIGRMAKEMKIEIGSMLISDVHQFSVEGLRVAHEVFENSGVDPLVGKHLPFDRGDLHAAMMQLCLRLANAAEEKNSETARKLRTAALTIGATRAERGSLERTGAADDLIALLREAWLAIDDEGLKTVRKESGDVLELTNLFEESILVVTSNAAGTSDKALRLDTEVREIREAFRRSRFAKNVRPDHLTASTIDDFRRQLLDEQYDIIHFSGHASKDGLSFMNGPDDVDLLEYDGLAALLKNQTRLKCLVLNACNSLESINESIGVEVIGMIDTIDDEAAIEFSKGFYDAVAAGRSVADAFSEGVLSMKTKGCDEHVVARLAAS